MRLARTLRECHGIPREAPLSYRLRWKGAGGEVPRPLLPRLAVVVHAGADTGDHVAGIARCLAGCVGTGAPVCLRDDLLVAPSARRLVAAREDVADLLFHPSVSRCHT